MKSEIGLAERVENPCVGGSIPPRATKNSKRELEALFFHLKVSIDTINLVFYSGVANSQGNATRVTNPSLLSKETAILIGINNL